MTTINKQIINLIIHGKLAEKKHLNKNIIKKNLQKILLHFDQYKESEKSDILLKNILTYTKIVKVDPFYLNNFYQSTIRHFLKNENCDITLLPNIVHTFKQQKQFKYVLKEVQEIVIKRMKNGVFFFNNECYNDWISVLQEFSKYQDLRFQPFLLFILNQIEKGKNSSSPCTIKNDEKYVKTGDSKYDVIKSSYTKSTTLPISWERLTPRSLSILVNLLSKDKGESRRFLSNLVEYVCKHISLFNSIDLCLIIHSLYNVKFMNWYFAERANKEVLNKTNSFDFLQLSFLFRNLSKYWDEEQKRKFATLFLKKVQKYLNLYLLNRNYKYILFTEKKNSVIEIISMFFLSFVKNSNFFCPLYIDFTRTVMCILIYLNTCVLVIKGNSFLRNRLDPSDEFLKSVNLNNDCVSIIADNFMVTIAQFLCNFLYAYSGYLYNIMTISTRKNENKMFWNHLHTSLNAITQIFYFFTFFYNNKKFFIKKEGTFIIPLQKCQLLIFFYFYWDFILQIFFSLSNLSICDIMKNSSFNLKRSVIKRFSAINLLTRYDVATLNCHSLDVFNEQLKLLLHLLNCFKCDSLYFIKLEYLRRIFFILNIMEKVEIKELMKKSIERKNEQTSSVYTEITEVVNSLKRRNNFSFFINRFVEGPFTVSILCSSEQMHLKKQNQK